MENLADANSQKCNVPHCTSTHLISTSVSNDTDECPICMEVLDSNECAMMQGCDHIYCSGCIACWMGDIENPSCPLCRAISPLTIVTKTPFIGEERRALFKEHMKCQLNHPDLKPFLDNVDNEEWKTFFGFVMNSDDRRPTSFYIDFYLQKNSLDLKSAGSTFFTFSHTRRKFVQAIIHLRLPGVMIQILFMDKYFDQDYDNELADKFIGYLNQQWKHSWKAIPHIFQKEPILVMRNFWNVTCALNLNLITSEKPKPCVESEMKFKNELRDLPYTNLSIKSMMDYYQLIWEGFLIEVVEDYN